MTNTLSKLGINPPNNKKHEHINFPEIINVMSLYVSYPEFQINSEISCSTGLRKFYYVKSGNLKKNLVIVHVDRNQEKLLPCQRSVPLIWITIVYYCT